MADGKAAHGSQTAEGGAPPADRRPLVDDLFDRAFEPPPGQAPLDPADLGQGDPPGVEPPTERIDLERASALDPAPSPMVAVPFTLEDPAPASADPPQPLDIGLAVGLGAAPEPSPRSPSDAVLGLPVGSQPPPAAPRLPCTALIVAEDRAAGAATAAGLMAEGYTCRAATVHELSDGLSGVDVVVVRGPLPEAALEGYSGAVVGVGVSGPPPARPGWARLEADAAGAPLVAAIETARSEALVAAAAHEAAAEAPVARVVRPESLAGAGHREVDGHAVRALFIGLAGRSVRGQVRSISPSGQLLVDVAQPPPADQSVTAELIVVDGRRAELPGVVTRSGEGQMLLELEVGAAQGEVLAQFIRETQDPSQPTIEQVRIRARRPEEARAAPAAPKLVDDETLRRMFDAAAQALDDDAKQQAFIQACIKAERLPFAVQCYRELKADRPEDERVAKYLGQVGTILGFYAFHKADAAPQEGGMPRTLKWALFAFIFAALALWVIVAVLAG